jgi:hypothetical protein
MFPGHPSRRFLSSTLWVVPSTGELVVHVLLPARGSGRAALPRRRHLFITLSKVALTRPPETNMATLVSAFKGLLQYHFSGKVILILHSKIIHFSNPITFPIPYSPLCGMYYIFIFFVYILVI